jgi:hypothetical protein
MTGWLIPGILECRLHPCNSARQPRSRIYYRFRARVLPGDACRLSAARDWPAKGGGDAHGRSGLFVACPDDAPPVWRCEIVLVPAAVVWTGYYIRGSFSAELGWWLMLCALSFMLRRRLMIWYGADVRGAGERSRGPGEAANDPGPRRGQARRCRASRRPQAPTVAPVSVRWAESEGELA